MEYFADLMCAHANAHHAWHRNIDPSSPAMAPDLRVHITRLEFFVNLFDRMHSSLGLELRPAALAVPTADRVDAWKCVIDSLPSSSTADSAINSALKHRAQELLRKTTASKYASDVIDYTHAKWVHVFPDDRAHQLCRAHYVLLLEFALQPQASGPHSIVVQATVHPSQRNYTTHFAQISYLNSAETPSAQAFALQSSACSCEAGCAACGCCSNLICCLGGTGSARMCKRYFSRSLPPSATQLVWYVAQ